MASASHSPGPRILAATGPLFMTPLDYVMDAIADAGYSAVEVMVGQNTDTQDPERIVAYGRSLGGGVVAELAAARPLAALGLESSFASLPRLVSELGWPSWLLRDRFVPEQALADFAAPVLLVHGWRDEVIGIGHAHSLRAALPQAQLLELDCGHNDCPRPWPAWLALLAEAGVLPLAPPVAESAQGNAWR